jgi:hypothetical protein
MEHDFLYCPKCIRYSVFHWVRGLGQWECEDCGYKPPKEELVASAAIDALLTR